MKIKYECRGCGSSIPCKLTAKFSKKIVGASGIPSGPDKCPFAKWRTPVWEIISSVEAKNEY